MWAAATQTAWGNWVAAQGDVDYSTKKPHGDTRRAAWTAEEPNLDGKPWPRARGRQQKEAYLRLERAYARAVEQAGGSILLQPSVYGRAR